MENIIGIVASGRGPGIVKCIESGKKKLMKRTLLPLCLVIKLVLIGILNSIDIFCQNKRKANQRLKANVLIKKNLQPYASC